MSAPADSASPPGLGYSYPSRLQTQMVNNWGLSSSNPSHTMPTPYAPNPTPAYLMGGSADPYRSVDYVTFDPSTGYPLAQGDTGSLAALQQRISTYIGTVFPGTPTSVATNIYRLITAPTGNQYYQTQSFTGTKVSTATPHARSHGTHASAAPLPLTLHTCSPLRVRLCSSRRAAPCRVSGSGRLRPRTARPAWSSSRGRTMAGRASTCAGTD